MIERAHDSLNRARGHGQVPLDTNGYPFFIPNFIEYLKGAAAYFAATMASTQRSPALIS